MIVTAAPFLMFQGACEAALTLYVQVIPGARIVSLEKKPDGTVAMARLAIAGLEILANDSPPVHDFDFTPSTSTFLTVDTVEEVDALASALGEGGKTMMPPGDYGFSPRFAWVQDRFGVSWQINAA
ncbi:VOC family protein [Brevundimonas sp.]|jgi:predicted 3-demethylubiquinone-9 3-methyltransferase (glyoxalase superfamily)|uniref:VOC family protein n=1 Tax=Brevundimonas sp. TaxID=1871086 RepID=UPI0037BEDCE4